LRQRDDECLRLRSVGGIVIFVILIVIIVVVVV
jgi:hypothetical protein